MESVMTVFSALTLPRLAFIVILAIVCWFVAKQVLKIVEKLLERSRLDKSLHKFIYSVVKVLVYFVVVLILADSLGISITSLIAAFSIVGLAVSLAVQGALSNVANGLTILITKPFKVGDFIECGAHSGIVDEINLVSTKILTLDHKKVFIPNSDIGASRVVNYSVAGNRRVDMNFTASYDCAIEDVKAAILEAAEAIPEVLHEPDDIFIKVSAYNESNIEYVVRVWTKNENYWTVYFALMEGVKASFDRNNIAMTYPHLNVHVNQA